MTSIHQINLNSNITVSQINEFSKAVKNLETFTVTLKNDNYLQLYIEGPQDAYLCWMTIGKLIKDHLWNKNSKGTW